MKKALSLSLLTLSLMSATSSYAAKDCRDVFYSYGNKQVYELLSKSSDNPEGIIFGSAIASGFAIGGILENTGALGTYATLGSTIPIASFFVPGLLYLGVEGGIALSNMPHTKAANLITQAYRYRYANNDKRTKLLKRLARRLDLSVADLAETIIQSNEDGTLCKKNETKKDILASIRNNEIPVIDVNEDTYSQYVPRWTCGAQRKYSRGGYYQANGETRSKAKKMAKLLCAEGEGVHKCKWVGHCENNHTGTYMQYF